MIEKNLLPYNLQFFAEDPDDDDNQDDVDNNNEGKDGKDDHANHGGEKTFTQEDVNRMMAKEKREGRSAAFKSLGFESEDEAKSAFNLLKALTDSQKSDEQKAKEQKDNAIGEKDAAVKRAEAAEAKLSCVLKGVSKDSIDDVLSIAMKKVSEDKSLDDVLDDMSKEKKYSSFFTNSDGKDESDKGTGRNPGHHKTGSDDEKPGDYGKRLAGSSTPTQKRKNSYFD